jgi:hypothetical protein
MAMAAMAASVVGATIVLLLVVFEALGERHRNE